MDVLKVHHGRGPAPSTGIGKLPRAAKGASQRVEPHRFAEEHVEPTEPALDGAHRFAEQRAQLPPEPTAWTATASSRFAEEHVEPSSLDGDRSELAGVHHGRALDGAILRAWPLTFD